MMTCDVCGKETVNSIEIRLWDYELDDLIEGSVCSGDCAKAWIDDDPTPDAAADDDDDGAPIAPDFADRDELTHPGWARDVEVAPGQAITYTAHAATDPETVAALDELAKAAYAHMVAMMAAKTPESETEQ